MPRYPLLTEVQGFGPAGKDCSGPAHPLPSATGSFYALGGDGAKYATLLLLHYGAKCAYMVNSAS